MLLAIIVALIAVYAVVIYRRRNAIDAPTGLAAWAPIAPPRQPEHAISPHVAVARPLDSATTPMEPASPYGERVDAVHVY